MVWFGKYVNNCLELYGVIGEIMGKINRQELSMFNKNFKVFDLRKEFLYWYESYIFIYWYKCC